MDIVLMNNSSPVNQVSKSLTTLATVSGYLRDTSSIIEPIFMIEGSISSWANLNYCYIAAFHRYYYVNNIVSIRSGVFEVHCKVDVLMSYASGIKAHSALVRRQRSEYNLLINDGSIRTYANAYTLTYNFPQGFSGNSLILCVAGT